MLTYGQARSGVMGRLRGFARRIQDWWLSMTDEEQNLVRLRGAAVAGCAIMVSVGLPVVSANYGEQRVEAAERETAMRFASAIDVRDAIDPLDRSELLDHPWLVSVEYALERSPEDALSRYGAQYRDAAAIARVASFDPRHVEKAERTESDFECLSEAIYYEARSENEWGQLAVAEVVMNRVRDHRYPDNVCDVVFQGSERTTGCQFSFTCDGSMRHKPTGDAWREAQTIAMHVLLELNEQITGEATHYHTDYVDPVWNASLIKTKVYGTHIFYRFPRGAEWAMVRERQERAVQAELVKASAPAQPKRAIVPASEATSRDVKVIRTSSASPAP